MSRYNLNVYCDGCGVEITWAPVITYHKVELISHTRPTRQPMFSYKREFCCKDCSEGRACKCCERWEMEEGRRSSTPEWLESA